MSRSLVAKEGLVLGGVVGLVAGLPVAFRSEERALLAWLAAAGVITCVAGPVVAMLRAAPFARAERALLWALGIAAAPLALLAALLKGHTHHRQLGGATFALAATAGVVVLWAFLARGQSWAANRGQARGYWLAAMGSAALSVIACLLVASMAGEGALRAIEIALCVALVAGAGVVPWKLPAGAIGRLGPVAVALVLGASVAVAVKGGLASSLCSSSAIVGSLPVWCLP